MPDITGILATFKKKLFSGKVMIIILMCAVMLLVIPNDWSEFILNKTGIPYSPQIIAFSLSVVIFCTVKYLLELVAKLKIKRNKNRYERAVLKLVVNLNDKELDVIRHLLHSGQSCVEFNSPPPKYIQSLVNKQLIMQIGFPNKFHSRCSYMIIGSVEKIIRDDLKKAL